MKKQITVDGKTVTVTNETQQYFEGDVIITDPCYFIPENLWDALCNQVWFPEGIHEPLADGGTIYLEGGVTLLYSSTAHGDGGYTVKEADSGSDEFGVDSGTMCVITKKHFSAISDEVLSRGLYAVVEDFSGDVYFEDGNFQGDLTVITDGSDDESGEWESTLQDGLDEEEDWQWGSDNNDDDDY